MHSHLLDSYAHGDSPIHRLPAVVKFVFAVGLVLGVVGGGMVAEKYQVYVLCSVAVVVMGVGVLSRIPVRFLVKRLLLLEPLAVGVALLALWQPHGLQVFGFLVVRSTLCLAVMILWANTTPFGEMLRVMERLGMPGILVTIIALMYRYLFVLSEEALRMRRARGSRTFTPGRVFLWRNLSTVLGQLFVRSLDRADRIYVAMCARGWK